MNCLKFLLASFLSCIAALSAAHGATANVAKDGIAYANQPLYGNANPQLLIDGSKSPQIHGDVNLAPGFAYTVDLGVDRAISEFKIYPRQDGCCPDRLTNFRISIHADNGGALGAEVWGANQLTDGSNPGSGAGLVYTVTVPTPKTGRWVQIQSLANPVPNYALQINELEVFAEVQPSEINRAEGGLATASQATYGGAPASYLVDGNRGSFIHGIDAIQPGFHYDINLNVEVTMAKIDVFARQDGCCPDRLTNYRVSVHKDNAGQIGDKVWSADLHTDGTNPGSGVGMKDTVTADLDPAGTFKGQWVRIESLDDPVASYALQVSEVEVFGTIPEAVRLLINAEPRDTAVGVGQTATFTVGVNLINGDPAQLAFQWMKNGVDIPNSNAASYTTPVILGADSGAKYSVRVSYPGHATLTSREALLRVNYAFGATVTANGPLWPPGGFSMQQLVDGNRNNFLHGDAELPTGYKYEFKLGGVVNFDAIDIYPRQDGCCPDRMNNFRVSIHNDDNGTIGQQVWSADLYTDGTNPGATAGSVAHVVASMDAAGTFKGQWIRILALGEPPPAYHLQMGELEAFGTLVDTVPKLSIVQLSPSALAAPGRTTTISVTANVFNGSSSNITYQWSKGGTAIPDATNRVYTTPVLQQSDLGAQFRVTISYPGIASLVSDPIAVEFDYNYARGSAAFANQKLWVGVPTWTPGVMVDGSRTSFVHGDTGLVPGYAYTFNMGDEVTLTNIDIYPRQDGCCPDRVTNIRVSIHKDNDGQIGDQVWFVDLFTDGSNAGSGAGILFTLTPDMDPAGTFKGQWIKIMSLQDPVPDYALQIGEVEAYGSIAGRPQLTWTFTDGFRLSWDSGVLESTTDLGATWNPVNGASSPYLVPRNDLMRFFRVKK